ncbi:MAG: ribonuclease Z [Bacteroidetes bacterium]|nr:ribonuclease Z [Bacteroidota bacterium]
MHFELTILGSNGAIPAYDRHPTSHFLNYNGDGFLLDCGEGTQMQMARYNIKRGRLDHIFITHLHGDHFFGLMGLITSFNLNYREHTLHIHGPKGIEEIVRAHFTYAQTQLRYAIEFHVVTDDRPQVVYENSQLTVESIILRHRIPTTGYLFREKPGQRKILPEKIALHEIPVSEIGRIKQGADYTKPDGSVIANHDLTTDPAPARSYAFCTDTVYTETFLDQIQGVSVLYHEATFVNMHRERAAETMHSTTTEAATIALKANAGKLIIGHYSARYEDLAPLLEECKEVFTNTALAIEGQSYII